MSQEKPLSQLVDFIGDLHPRQHSHGLLTATHRIGITPSNFTIHQP